MILYICDYCPCESEDQMRIFKDSYNGIVKHMCYGCWESVRNKRFKKQKEGKK